MFERGSNLPSIAVARGEAHEAVGQLVLVNPAAELAALVRSSAQSLVVVSNNSLSDQSSEVVVRVPADTFHCQGDVSGGHGIVANTDVGADEVSLLLGQEIGVVLRPGSRETGEVLLSKLNQLLVGDATSTNQDHAVGSVVVLDVVGELGSGDVLDILAGAEDGTAEGLVLEGSGV